MNNRAAITALLAVSILCVGSARAQEPVRTEARNHSVWVDTSDSVGNADECVWYAPSVMGPSHAAVTWRPTNNIEAPAWSHFFRAEIRVKGTPSKYEFILSQVSMSTASVISGTWTVIVDGRVRSQDCAGRVWGLDSPVAGSLMLSCVPRDTMSTPGCDWGFSALVSQRYDF